MISCFCGYYGTIILFFKTIYFKDITNDINQLNESLLFYSTLNSNIKVKQAIKIVALTRLENSNNHILCIRKI